MGQTLTALQAGSTSYVLVVALEGYRNLLTNAASTAAAVAAWAGTDYTTAIGGLYVDAQHSQQINPWEPFGSGGKCVIKVTQDASDAFGIDTHRKGGSYETILTAELDRNDTQVSVKNTTLFDATGEIHIGTECIAYTGKTPSSGLSPGFFTGCTRGKYSPFAAGGSETARFGNHHRVGTDSQSTKLQPVVSSIPRVWAGRRVGIWVHRVVDGVLDVLAEAHCVFSGRIVEVRDDPGSIATVVECEHILDEVKEGSVGRDLWSAKIKPGVYLSLGMTFSMQDSGSSGVKNALALTVVVGGASGANQINAGFYSHYELFSKLEAWWVSELAAARLYGAYAISISDWGGDLRTKIFATITGTGGTTSHYALTMPKVVACLLGFSTATNPSLAVGTVTVDEYVTTGVEDVNPALDPPLRMIILRANSATVQFDWNRVQIVEQRGSFFDQLAYWPGPPPVTTTTYEGWGIFLIGGKITAFGNKRDVVMVGGAISPEIGSLLPLSFQFSGVLGADIAAMGSEPFTGTADDAIEIRQVLILESSLRELLCMLFYSTGTTGYNHSTYDTLPTGIGIPFDLLGSAFETSVQALPGSSESAIVVIDEPTTMADLFGGDFILRRAFTLWKEGGVRLGTWRTPTTAGSVATLAETNKAEPAGHDADQRSATAQTSEWARSVIKIDYNRDITEASKDGGYRDSITFEDATAVDDAGGRSKLFTIKARNTYGQVEATGAGVETLAPGFLSFMPLVSRPAWKIRRSIDCRYFEGLSVGDVVLFTDEFARDPETGTRGITVRPAIVTMHKWGFGGRTSADGEPDPMGGEVELFFPDHSAAIMPYAPAADVDYTAVTGGYDYGYSTSEVKLRLFDHHYSQASAVYPLVAEDPIDATRFAAGYKIKIIERDPIDLTAPVVWERTVASQTGSDIVLTAAISSPSWDNTKKFRVVFDDHDAVVAAQQAWVFSASSVDGLILDATQSYRYGSGSPAGGYLANATMGNSELVELVPDIIPVEAAGRDVGYERQIARLADAIIDYKTTSSPYLFNTVLTNTDYVTGYQLVAATPAYLMWELLSPPFLRRYISVAPFFRSADGRAVFLRISLYRDAPHDTTLNDQNPGIVGQGCVFVTTSTTWSIPDPDVLYAELKDWVGNCWIQIECSYMCETYGIARFVEGARTE